MSSYVSTDQIKDRLGGTWGADSAIGPGSRSGRDTILADLGEACSRMFDHECGKATNFYAPGTVTRYYSGSGDQALGIDDFDAVTAVSMSSSQDRSGAITLSVSDPTSVNYVVTHPTAGPPFTELFLLRGWLPDPYGVGNVAVTGTVSTPVDVVHAVAVWAAYTFKARDAGWQDVAGRPDGPGMLYVKGIPPETARIIAYYQGRGESRGPRLALEDGSGGRVSRWLGWRTAG